MGLHRIETEKEKSTCLKPRLRIRAEALPPTCSLHLHSINHYITIIPIAIPIIPISADCGPNAAAEPVVVAEAIAADALLEREEITDAVGVAADAPDLVAPVAVAGAMVPVVPLGRTRSTPRFLQSPTVMVCVSEEEVRCQYGSGLSAGQNKEFYVERVTYFQNRLLSSLFSPRVRGR